MFAKATEELFFDPIKEHRGASLFTYQPTRGFAFSTLSVSALQAQSTEQIAKVPGT